MTLTNKLNTIDEKLENQIDLEGDINIAQIYLESTKKTIEGIESQLDTIIKDLNPIYLKKNKKNKDQIIENIREKLIKIQNIL